MDTSEIYKKCQALQAELFGLKQALRVERAKRQEYMHRVTFLENLIAEYAKTTRRPRQDEWVQVTPRLRFAVFLRDNFTCTYCGASSEGGTELTVDHITPRSAGGKTVIRNLRTACMACNKGKGATLVDLEAMLRPSRRPSADARGKEIGLTDSEAVRPSDERAVNGSLPEKGR